MKIAMPADSLEQYPWGGPILVLVDPTAAQLQKIYLVGYGEVLEAGAETGFELASSQAALWADAHAAELVKGIDAESRRALQTLIHDSLEDTELSQADLAGQIGDLFDGMAETRADLIARNETALASNQGNLGGYRSFGAQYVMVGDGPDCGWTSHTDADTADGSIRTLEEAENYPLAHPNCGRSFSYIPTDQVDPASVAATAI